LFFWSVFIRVNPRLISQELRRLMTSAARKVVTTSGGQWRWSLLSRTVARFTLVTSLADNELRQRSLTFFLDDGGAGVCKSVGATELSQLSKDSFRTVAFLRTTGA